MLIFPPELYILNIYYSTIRENSSKHISSNNNPLGLELGWVEQGFPQERKQKKLRQILPDCFHEVKCVHSQHAVKNVRWGRGARIGRPNTKTGKFIPGDYGLLGPCKYLFCIP